MCTTIFASSLPIADDEAWRSKNYYEVALYSFKFVILLLLRRRIRPSGLLPSELIWKYGSNRQLVGLLGREISPSEGRYLHRTKQTQNKRGQTSMPRVGFEPTMSVFERAKTFHASDRAATVSGTDTFIILPSQSLHWPRATTAQRQNTSMLRWYENLSHFAL
jgi:hypothetical protein